MLSLVRRTVARPLPRRDLLAAAAVTGGFLALLAADALPPGLIAVLQLFLTS